MFCRLSSLDFSGSGFGKVPKTRAGQRVRFFSFFAEVQVEPDAKNILKYLARIEKQQNKECRRKKSIFK